MGRNKKQGFAVVYDKISIGITVFGILSIIFSLFIFSFIVIPDFLLQISNMYTIAYLITALCWLIFGIGVLKRLPWARIGLIIVAGIYVIDSIEYPSHILSAIRNSEIHSLVMLGIGLMFFVSLIIFFTRSNIKQHFTKKN